MTKTTSCVFLIVLLLPLTALSQVEVTLTPTSPTDLPAGGGTLDFDVTIVSTLPDAYPDVLFWTRAQLPNGNLYPPILFSYEFTLQPFMDATIGLSQYIPIFAPAGNYQLIGYVGFNPDQGPQVSDGFPFSKTGTIIEEDFELADTGVFVTMVWIEPGTFWMGALDEDYHAHDYEYPRHQVTISEGFWMGKYEVTQEQWTAILGTWDFHFDDLPTHPAERISYDDATSIFLPLINENEVGDPWRLPTEAEWEYACRGGYDETRFWWGDDYGYIELGYYAWNNENSDDMTHPVGRKYPNPWGLYDTHGNVWEWCSDWYGSNYYENSPGIDPPGPANGTNRVLRGGSWGHAQKTCRSSYRGYYGTQWRNVSVGFRLVRSAPSQ